MSPDIINLQNRAVTQIVKELKGSKNVITFKAPTGSGKTYMMADFMNRILEENEKVVFLVSSLSKGELAEQNYDKFCSYVERGMFGALKPWLISTESSGEEAVHIPTEGYNVYILPRDLYKNGGILMRGGMERFLRGIKYKEDGITFNKDIILVKDECHIETTNLNTISDSVFKKVLNISATPDPKKKQYPDVEITSKEAEAVNLIKRVEWGDDKETVEVAINKLKEIKADYDNLLGVNPCLIIQISNKDKAEEEWDKIYNILNKAENQHLKWIYIVGDDKKCKTNDSISKLPVSKWKEFAKKDNSLIDVIIFKMVISEGWDIPRACMIYQVRESQSQQMDVQVVGRVRRNPRLLDFERLSEKGKQLAMTAWVWGVPPKEMNKPIPVSRVGGAKDVPEALRLKTVVLKDINERVDFDLDDYLDKCTAPIVPESIFVLNEKLTKSNAEIQQMCYDYAKGDIQRWFRFVENIDGIKKNFDSYICDYSKSMEILKDEEGNEKFVSFPIGSINNVTGDVIRISDWVWKRRDGQMNFSFDSQAEKEWAELLKDLKNIENIKVSKSKKADEMPTLGSDFAAPKDNKYLWGKNFLANSEIRFEYYLDGIHSSYPDFIMKDGKGIIHIFEVKSLNKSNQLNIDEEEYQEKVAALKKCYEYCSKLTEYYFYLPIKINTEWKITRYVNGELSLLSEEEFFDSINN